MKGLSYRSVPKVPVLPTPSSLLDGVILELSTDGKPYWCNGTTWTDLTATGGGGSMVVRDETTSVVTAPSAMSFVGDGVSASLVATTEAKVQIDDPFLKPGFITSSLYNTYSSSSLMAAGNGILVYINSNGGTTDPVSWRCHIGGDDWALSSTLFPSGFLPRVLTYGNGRFVLLGTISSVSKLMYSLDGITWSSVTPPVTTLLEIMPFGNGVFVVWDSVLKCPWNSIDGITWNQGTALTENPTHILYGKGKFYASLYTAANTYTSTDGLTWTLLGSIVAANYWTGTVVEFNGQFVNPGGVASSVITSSDMLTLTVSSPAGLAAYTSIPSGNMVWVGGGYIFVVDTVNRVLYYSADTLIWRSMSIPASWRGNAGIYTNESLYLSSGNGSTYGYFYRTRILNNNTYADSEGGQHIDLCNAPSPGTPRAMTTRLFGKTLANRTFPAFVGATNLDSVVQPSIWRQKIARWNPPGGATTLPGVDGMQAPTALGTATLRAVATTNLLTRTRRFWYASAATAAAFCGHYNTLAQFTTGNGNGLGGFFYSCRFAITDPAAVSGARMFIGLSALVAAPTNVEPNSLANHIGVAQLSGDATQLQFVCRGSADGSGLALGTNFPPMSAVGATNGIVYDLTIYAPPSQSGVVYMRLERVGTSYVVEQKFAAGSTFVPTATTLLAHRAYRTNNATLLACGLDIIHVYVETDY